MTMDSSQLLVSLLGDLGAMGFILYLTHRLTTHTIPRLAEQFETATEKQRQDFKEMLAEQRQDFAAWHQRENAFHEAQTSSLVEAVKDLASEIRGGK